MSNSSSAVPGERDSRIAAVKEADSLREGVRVLAAPFRVVAFWMAIALPFLYLPLLYRGLSGQEATVLIGLVALNGLALVLGHDYRR